MPTGKVKWFDPKKGYGFIIPDDGGRDLFVHITAVQKAGYTDLVQGVRVSYEIRPDREEALLRQRGPRIAGDTGYAAMRHDAGEKVKEDGCDELQIGAHFS